jgi:hypothetical protein
VLPEKLRPLQHVEYDLQRESHDGCGELRSLRSQLRRRDVQQRHLRYAGV